MAVIIERTIIINRQYQLPGSNVLPSLTEKLENESPEGLLKSLEPDSVLYRIAKELTDHASKGNLSLERHLETRMALEKRFLKNA